MELTLPGFNQYYRELMCLAKQNGRPKSDSIVDSHCTIQHFVELLNAFVNEEMKMKTNPFKAVTLSMRKSFNQNVVSVI